MFIKNSSLAAGTLAISQLPRFAFAFNGKEKFVSQRRPLKDRKFVSEAVERKIIEAKKMIKDEELAWMFENSFPNTLDTTVTATTKDGRPDTYLITGDIDAMWLRDSSAQVWPYLPLMKDDKKLQNMITGVVNRHAFYVLVDPYANAFYNDKKRKGHDDKTVMKPWVHERKWEVDSLCYVIRLAHGYWKHSNDTSCFDSTWLQAMKTIVATFKSEQRKDGKSAYNFKRLTTSPTDTAAGGGAGAPVNPVGLICSVFRPSDDGTVFPFLIPSNYFAVQSLRQLAEIVDTVLHEKDFANDCLSLAKEVETALKEYAVVDHKKAGKILAYEIDGYGAHYLIDDSNIPSLVSLPYLGALSTKDTLYKSTRRFLLTAGNHPYYAKGKSAEGTTGPHAGREMIWPMGIIIRAMTSLDDDEIKKCIAMLSYSCR
jgi:meiotically up-regulated gene 157 (Mug157) protein